jgi:hypothetical protein
MIWGGVLVAAQGVRLVTVGMARVANASKMGKE